MKKAQFAKMSNRVFNDWFQISSNLLYEMKRTLGADYVIILYAVTQSCLVACAAKDDCHTAKFLA